MFVFGEEIIENSQGGLQIVVDNVFRSRFRFGQSSILHQIESQIDIRNFFGESLELIIHIMGKLYKMANAYIPEESRKIHIMAQNIPPRVPQVRLEKHHPRIGRPNPQLPS